MTPLSVRQASAADLHAVIALVRSCIEHMRSQGIEQWDDIYPSRDRLSSDGAAGSLYVAGLPEQEIVAVFALDSRQDPEYATVPWTLIDDRIGVVHRLMVDPRFQGRGVARELMMIVERLAAELGYAVIRLDAFSLNPAALRLYRGLGYHEAGAVTLRKGVFRVFEKRLGDTAPGT
jgi:ribosomal protein S18 acetylase RimI-like enzyme